MTSLEQGLRGLVQIRKDPLQCQGFPVFVPLTLSEFQFAKLYSVVRGILLEAKLKIRCIRAGVEITSVLLLVPFSVGEVSTLDWVLATQRGETWV